MTPPRVFISYSHDSAQHKSWVLKFATILRHRKIDAVLDQWDLGPGDDLPHFMETELAQCDYVIMVCTANYVSKANEGKGSGVAYEKMIITGSLLKDIGDSKIIPIVRQSTTPVLPTFIKTKKYVNFSNDEEEEYSLDELLRKLLNTPLFEKPEIGTKPFEPLADAKPDRTADGIKAVMTIVAAAFEKSTLDELSVAFILEFSDMHRLKLENYLSKAVAEGLLTQGIFNQFSVTEDGYQYLVNHGIVKE